VSYLLLPADERLMAQVFCGEWGWAMLSGTVSRGSPQFLPVDAPNPPDAALIEALPAAGEQGMTGSPAFLFWSSEWGPVVSVGDAPEPPELVRRVIRRHRAERSGPLADLVDPYSTPLIRYQRCFWASPNHLSPGFLKGMDRPRQEWPSALQRAFGQAERWLKRDAVKINPFDYASEDRVERVSTWVRPAAWRWLQEGGRLRVLSF
jgi:hypothetical protein